MLGLPIKDRCIQMADLYLESGLTLRELAPITGYSKSSMHVDLTRRLKMYDGERYKKVAVQLAYMKSIRHINGGEMTRRKWLQSSTPKELVS